MTFRALALDHSDVAKDNPNGNLAGKTAPPPPFFSMLVDGNRKKTNCLEKGADSTKHVKDITN